MEAIDNDNLALYIHKDSPLAYVLSSLEDISSMLGSNITTLRQMAKYVINCSQVWTQKVQLSREIIGMDITSWVSSRPLSILKGYFGQFQIPSGIDENSGDDRLKFSVQTDREYERLAGKREAWKRVTLEDMFILSKLKDIIEQCIKSAGIELMRRTYLKDSFPTESNSGLKPLPTPEQFRTAGSLEELAKSRNSSAVVSNEKISIVDLLLLLDTQNFKSVLCNPLWTQTLVPINSELFSHIFSSIASRKIHVYGIWMFEEDGYGASSSRKAIMNQKVSISTELILSYLDQLITQIYEVDKECQFIRSPSPNDNTSSKKKPGSETSVSGSPISEISVSGSPVPRSSVFIF